MRTYFSFLLLLFIFTFSCKNGSVHNEKSVILSRGGSSDTLSVDDLYLLKRIAADRNTLITVSRKKFDKITLYNQQKTAGIINELLNRAEQKILGELPPGRFPWSWDGFDPPSGMVTMAEGFLDSLSAGIDPFKRKFAEPGGSYIVDHTIIKKDDLYHLFYIRGTAATNWPEYPQFNFGHAISRDLVNWQEEKPVLQVVNTGFDTYQVWAPHIIQYRGKYWMFYAGVNNHVCQAICLATSDDLYTWTRNTSNPILTSKPWGEWDTSKWSDCRDPMILNDNGIFYCYFTAARINPETKKSEYCLGIAGSHDLLHWENEEYIRLKYSLTTPPESPFVVKKKRKYTIYFIQITNTE